MVKARTVLVPLSVAGLVAIATLPLGRIYHGTLLTWLLLGAAVAPVLLSAVLQRLPAYPVAPVSVLALGGYTLWAVQLSDGADQHVYERLIGEKRGQGLADLLEPLAGAWHGCTRCGER